MIGYVQLLCHLLGDYILQNDWMALNKKQKGFVGLSAIVIHAALYSASFAIAWAIGLAPNLQIVPALALIFVSHFVIDRWNIPIWITQLKNFNFAKKVWAEGKPGKANTLFIGRPAYIGVWLSIIVDNTLHLIINFAIIALLSR